jgi:hypothetical protein
MRALALRGGELRRRKAKQRDELEELTDREQAMAALRRALDGRNHAAMVAAAKALIDSDQTPPPGPMGVDDARAQLDARLDKIDTARGANGDPCPTCGVGIVPRAMGAGPVAGIDGGRVPLATDGGRHFATPCLRRESPTAS